MYPKNQPATFLCQKCIFEMYFWNVWVKSSWNFSCIPAKIVNWCNSNAQIYICKLFTSLALRSTAYVHNLVFLDTPCANEERIDDDGQHCIQKCFPFGTVIKLMIDAPDHLPNSCNRNIYKKHKCKKHNNFKTTIVFQMHSTILAIYFDFRVWDRSKEKALRVLVYYSWWWRTVSIDKM